jgi:hypothetical protein
MKDILLFLPFKLRKKFLEGKHNEVCDMWQRSGLFDVFIIPFECLSDCRVLLPVYIGWWKMTTCEVKVSCPLQCIVCDCQQTLQRISSHFLYCLLCFRNYVSVSKRRIHIESDNKVLRRAFGNRTEEVPGRWGKFNIETFVINWILNIIRIITLKGVK